MKEQKCVEKPMEDFTKILDGAADRFHERGIKFCLATSKDEERVWKFMLESFIPDEPILRYVELWTVLSSTPSVCFKHAVLSRQSNFVLFLYRSMDFLREDTMVNRAVTNGIKKDFMTKCVHEPTAYSIIAEDDKGEVMGIKLGFKITRDKRLGNLFYTPAMKYFYWLLPRRMVDLNVIGWFLEEELEYHPNKTMDSMVRL